MKEAIARAQGDLGEAERVLAEDRVQCELIDQPGSVTAGTVTQPQKRQKTGKDSDPLSGMKKNIDKARQELDDMSEALREPVTERSTFIEFIRLGTKTISEARWDEFTDMYYDMRKRWKVEDRMREDVSSGIPSARSSRATSATSYHSGRSRSPGSRPPSAQSARFLSPSPCEPGHQPPPEQWRVPPRSVSVHESADQEFMKDYMNQPLHSQLPPHPPQLPPQHQFQVPGQFEMLNSQTGDYQAGHLFQQRQQQLVRQRQNWPQQQQLPHQVPVIAKRQPTATVTSAQAADSSPRQGVQGDIFNLSATKGPDDLNMNSISFGSGMSTFGLSDSAKEMMSAECAKVSAMMLTPTASPFATSTPHNRTASSEKEEGEGAEDKQEWSASNLSTLLN